MCPAACHQHPTRLTCTNSRIHRVRFAPSNRKGCWDTTPIDARSCRSGTLAMSRSSIRMVPEVKGVMRRSAATRLDFPAPVNEKGCRQQALAGAKTNCEMHRRFERCLHVPSQSEVS